MLVHFNHILFRWCRRVMFALPPTLVNVDVAVVVATVVVAALKRYVLMRKHLCEENREEMKAKLSPA